MGLRKTILEGLEKACILLELLLIALSDVALVEWRQLRAWKDRSDSSGIAGGVESPD